jgi:hypothetical protein
VTLDSLAAKAQRTPSFRHVMHPGDNPRTGLPQLRGGSVARVASLRSTPQTPPADPIALGKGPAKEFGSLERCPLNQRSLPGGIPIKTAAIRGR